MFYQANLQERETKLTLEREILKAYVTETINIFSNIWSSKFPCQMIWTFQWLQVCNKTLLLQVRNIASHGITAGCLVSYPVPTTLFNMSHFRENQWTNWGRRYKRKSNWSNTPSEKKKGKKTRFSGVLDFVEMIFS